MPPWRLRQYESCTPAAAARTQWRLRARAHSAHRRVTLAGTAQATLGINQWQLACKQALLQDVEGRGGRQHQVNAPLLTRKPSMLLLCHSGSRSQDKGP